MPGLIELHTDHLEMHIAAPKDILGSDRGGGFLRRTIGHLGHHHRADLLRVWREDGAEEVDGRAGVLAEAITSARDANLLRADHFLHLRCEIRCRAWSRKPG
jgi:alpha-D-ribose 1-methylphosphonate 5-triphosphate diphosphatase